MIDVEADGIAYQEMHADGGAVAQVFLYPASYLPQMGGGDVERSRRVYIIRNVDDRSDGFREPGHRSTRQRWHDQ